MELENEFLDELLSHVLLWVNDNDTMVIDYISIHIKDTMWVANIYIK